LSYRTPLCAGIDPDSNLAKAGFFPSRSTFSWRLRVAVVVCVVIIVIFFAVAVAFVFLFLFLFFLVWLLSKEDIGSYRPIRRV
jgi:hypothetical protein